MLTIIAHLILTYSHLFLSLCFHGNLQIVSKQGPRLVMLFSLSYLLHLLSNIWFRDDNICLCLITFTLIFHWFNFIISLVSLKYRKQMIQLLLNLRILFIFVLVFFLFNELGNFYFILLSSLIFFKLFFLSLRFPEYSFKITLFSSFFESPSFTLLIFSYIYPYFPAIYTQILTLVFSFSPTSLSKYRCW